MRLSSTAHQLSLLGKKWASFVFLPSVLPLLRFSGRKISKCDLRAERNSSGSDPNFHGEDSDPSFGSHSDDLGSGELESAHRILRLGDRRSSFHLALARAHRCGRLLVTIGKHSPASAYHKGRKYFTNTKISKLGLIQFMHDSEEAKKMSTEMSRVHLWSSKAQGWSPPEGSEDSTGKKRRGTVVQYWEKKQRTLLNS